jgi:hypothetical protein
MTKSLSTALLFLVGLVVAAAGLAQSKREVWKWTDPSGVVHFSDTPQPGATRLLLASSTSSSMAAPAGQASAATPATEPATEPAAERVRYESLRIVQPGSGETFFNADAQVPVGLTLVPALSRTDGLALYLDGQRIDSFPPRAFNYTLSGLPRGAHTLTAAVIDPDGNVLLRSEPRVFHIRQNSVANPPGRPGVKPVPRPTPRN